MPQDELKRMPDQETLVAVKDDICQSRTFSEDGFVNLLMQAIRLLKQGGLHESCVASYQMVLPIHARRGAYDQQRRCYTDLAEQCDRIVEAATHNETLRQFAKFYRVAFFGSAFEQLDGAEFVYKESSFTRVMDITERLKAMYAHLGEVELLPNKLTAREAMVAARVWRESLFSASIALTDPPTGRVEIVHSNCGC